MTDLTVTVSQITPLLQRMLAGTDRGPAPLVLIRGDLEDGAEPSVTINGQPVDLVASASPLEIRAVAGQDRDRPLAVITPCEQSSLGLDLVARALDKRVRSADRWESVAHLFGAEHPSKQLARHRQLADVLIEESAVGHRFPPTRSRTLDFDTAIAAVSNAVLGRTPDTLIELLAWAESPEARTAMQRLDGKEQVLELLQQHHVTELGAGAAVIHAALRHRFDRPLTGAAIAAHALVDRPDPQRPAVRGIEQMFGDPDLPIEAYRHLGQVAVQRAMDQPPGLEINAWIATADKLLKDWGWEDEAWRSPVSRLGFNQRLGHAANALQAWRQQPTDRGLEAEAESAAAHVAEHWQGINPEDPRRIERLRMAARVIRRGGFELEKPSTLAATLAHYRHDGAWLDQARGMLAQGDESSALHDLYQSLTEEADNARDDQSPAVGRVLTQAAMPATDGVIGIEDVIDQVIAPLAETVPVLVAVLDGMGWPSFLDVDRTLSRSGWIAVVDTDRRADQSVIATLPTVTEFSRTSLFSGQLEKGDAKTERRRFADHRALLAVGKRDKPPVIIHKRDLAADGGIDALPKEARETIGDPGQRVVAVVINNIDERLKEVANPLSGWDLEALAPLGSLLQQAREAGRAVVLTADHGHVLERKTEYQTGSGGERWRKPGDTPAGEDEVEVTGPRVLPGVDGQDTAIMPVIEQVRYSNARRHGYHGGLTLPEVAVPLAVYTAELDGIDGWEPRSFTPPSWWHPAPDGPEVETGAVTAKKPTAKPSKVKQPSPDQTQLFEPATPVEEPPSETEPGLGGPIARLLADTQIAERLQKNRLDPEQAAKALSQLDRYGTTAVGLDRLADQIGYPRMRMRRLLTQLQRVVNIDGAGVLEVVNNEEARFDRALLERQLGLA